MRHFAFTTAFLALAGQSSIQPDETVKLRYESLGGSVVEVVGVCRLTEDTVECWDPEGEPLTRIADAYRKILEGNDYNGRVTLQFGKKNRTLIVRVRSSRTGEYLSVDTNRANSLSSTSSQFNTLSQDAPREADFQYHMMSLHFELDAKETFVDVTQQLSVDSSIVIPLKAGTEFQFRGVTYVIGEPTIVKPSEYSNQLPMWKFPVESIGQEPRTINYSAAPYDKDGQHIAYVDEKGRPISRQEFERLFMPRVPNPRMYPMGSPNVYVSLSLLDNGRDGSIQTPIDPKYIDRLHIRPTWIRRVRIEGIPLDPRP